MGVISGHQLSTFSSPVNATSPIDANTVRGNDNTIRTAYNAHDADTTIHLQNGAISARPAASTAGQMWLASDTGAVVGSYDTGSAWVSWNYVATNSTGAATITSTTSPILTLAYDGTHTATFGVSSAGLLTISATTTIALATPVAITGGTVTTSTPVLDTAQTWNAAAVFVGTKLNVTDSSSSGPSGSSIGSLLMQLQVGGANKLAVSKAGLLYLGGTDVVVGALALPATGGLVVPDARVFAAAAASSLVLGQIGGSYASPTAIGSGLVIGNLTWQATQSTTAVASGADIRVNTTEAWSATAHGCSMIFEVTPNTTAAVAVVLTLGQDLSATFTGTLAIAGAFTGATSMTFTTSVKSTTALATPGAVSATQFTAFASTVSGATLMGFGTTGDVTLKNRAGTDVLVVTANTLNVTLAGDLSGVGDIKIGTNNKFYYGKTNAGTVTRMLGMDATTLYIGSVDAAVTGSVAIVNSANLLVFSPTGSTATFTGTIATAAPTGGAGAWKLGIANAVSPTAPNRTIAIDVGGTTYYLAAKTTND